MIKEALYEFLKNEPTELELVDLDKIKIRNKISNEFKTFLIENKSEIIKILSSGLSIEFVPVKDMLVDTTYQRNEDKNHIAHIVNNFDEKQLGFLELSKRKDGRYAVIDGQQRLCALKKLNKVGALARVWKNLTIKEEAKVFNGQNSRKPLSAVSLFRGLVASGDQESKDILQHLTECGYYMKGISQYKKGDLRVTSVSSMKQAYRLGADHFKKALDVYKKSFTLVNGEAVLGLTYLLQQAAKQKVEIESAVLSDKISKIGIYKIIADAFALQSINNFRRYAKFSQVFLAAYNFRRKNRICLDGIGD